MVVLTTEVVGLAELTLELLEEHHRLLRGCFAQHPTREVKLRQEGFRVEFGGALEAVRCALDLQARLAERNLTAPPPKRILVRAAVHMDTMDTEEVGSRLRSLAGPGQVCLSEEVSRQVDQKVSKGKPPQEKAYRVGLPGEVPHPSASAKHALLRRRAWRAGAALGLLALAAAGALLGHRDPTETEEGPLTLAVADFVNETREEALDGLSGMLTTSLEQSRRLSVMTRARMVDVLKQLDRDKVERIDEPLGKELCRRAHVGALVVGTVRRFGGLYTLELEVVDPARNARLFTLREEGKGQESIPGMLDRLSKALRVALRENQAEVRRASLAVAERTTSNFEAYQHYFQGEQLFARVSSNADVAGMEAAVREYQKAVELDPRFALAHYRLAFARLWVHDDPTGAIALAMRHLERAPAKERLYIRACDARVQGRLDEAAALYRQVLASYPNEKEALYFLGDLEFHRWNLGPSVENLERAVTIDPLFALAYEHLIEALARQGDFERARRYAWQYSERVPSEDSAHWLFSMLLLSEPLSQVEVDLRRALVAHPDRLEFVLAAPRIRALMKDWPGAEAQLRFLLDSPQQRVRRAGREILIWVSIYRGRFREAAALYAQAAREARDRGDEAEFAIDVASQASLAAWGHRDAGRLREIEAQIQPANNPWAEWEVARAWRLLGQWTPAVKVMGRFPGLASSDESYLRVVQLAADGRYPEAVKVLETIGEATHRDGFVQMEIAELAAAHGDPARVIAVLEPLLSGKLEPGEVLGWRNYYHPRGLYLLGRAYEATGNLQRAAERYGKLLVLWKDADPDLVDLQDARARLAALDGSGGGSRPATARRKPLAHPR